MSKKKVPRPYTTDYGSTQGHCTTPHKAVLAAGRYMDANNRRHVVIEQPNGPPIDVWWNGAWGFTVAVRKTAVLAFKKRA